MNLLKRKFWLWWFTKCPIGYSFMGHENGKLFWFYPFGINFRYRKGQYISIHLSGKLTKRALGACPRCDGKRRIWQADLSSKDTCYACRGTGKRQ